jgi:hypothetical protein
LYELHQKRQIIAGLESQKQAMVSALWSNSAYDDGKNTRQRAIADIENSYSEALLSVERALGTSPIPEEEKLDKDNPFFQAAERGLQKVDKRVAQMTGKAQPEDKEKDPIDYMKELDQA